MELFSDFRIMIRFLRASLGLDGAKICTALLLFLLPGVAAACPDIDGLLDTNCDRKLVIIAFGDSITAGKRDGGVGYPGRMRLLFPHAEIINYGVPGETTPDGRRRALYQIPGRREADFVIILEGVNDYYLSEKSPRQTRNNLLAIRNTANNIGAFSMLGKLTQTTRGFQRTWIRDVNTQIAPWTKIDFYSLGTRILSYDQLHPMGAGYQSMAELAGTVLRRESSLHRPLDSDRDGVYDYEEQRLGTNLTNRDSDGDGVSDGDELYVYGSSPLSSDSDGDGLPDGTEVSIGANPADPKPVAPVVEAVDAVI